MHEAFDEGAVKIEKAYCPSYFRDVFGYWPHVYAHDFYGVHACHPLFKDYPQVIHGGRMEKALLWFEIEVVGDGNLKDVTYCSDMIRHVSVGCNTNVVHVDTDCGTEGFVFENDITVDVVHHGLEGCQQICESEVHDRRFEQPIFGFKCCLGFVSFSDTYVVVSPSYVQLGVNMCITQITYEIRDKGKWILVSHCEGIDLSVVLYWS